MHLLEPENWPAIFHTLKVLVPYLDNASEKALSKCNQIKEKHEKKNKTSKWRS